MSVSVQQILGFLRAVAPQELALDWDNVGLLVDAGQPVDGVLTTLDIPPAVVREAVENDCQLIVSHHPVIFHPLRTLAADDVPALLMKNGISAICMHTNLDAAPGGVNDTLCDILGIAAEGRESFAEGCGRIGTTMPTTVEALAKLKGAFPVGPESPNPQVVHTFEPKGLKDTDDKGTQRVTAANASGINDGAAAIVLASGEAVKKYNLKPMAKLVSWGQGGVDPKIMGVGPVPASRQAMQKAGLTIDDIDLVEANEAFAAQSIAVARELHFDMSKVNVNGGAISIGHPVGASGARIIVTLLHEMLKRDDAKKGLATLCIGGGQGVATIFEKC